jgi:hypothetical protein
VSALIDIPQAGLDDAELEVPGMRSRHRGLLARR